MVKGMILGPLTLNLVPDLFLRFPLHSCNAHAQCVQLDKAFSVSLVVNLISLKGGEVDVEQAVGRRITADHPAVPLV